MVSHWCSKVAYTALILIPFSVSFSSSLTNLLIALSLLAFLIKKMASGDWKTIQRNPIFTPFLLIFIASLISFLHTVSIKASVQGIVKLLKYSGLFLAFTEELKDTRHARGIVTALILGLLLASVDGIFQLYTGKDFIRHWPYNTEHLGLPRLKAAFPHTNHFSTYLALFLPLGICLSLYEYKGPQRLFTYLTSILALFCLLFTFGRGSLLGFLIALVFISVMKKDKILLVAPVLMLTVLPFVLPHSIKAWTQTTGHSWEILWDAQKIGDWRNALNMIRHNPWVGVGVNTYGLNLETYRIRDSSRYVSPAGYAHNIYLHTLAEIGPLGLTAFLWLVVRLFRSGLQSYRCLEDSFLKTVSLGILAGLLAFLYNGISETSLYHSKIASLFWFYAGFLLGISKLALQGRSPFPSVRGER